MGLVSALPTSLMLKAVPHDVETEQATLGICLRSGSLAQAKLAGIGEDHFWSTRTKVVWQSMVELDDQRVRLTPRTLRKQLEARKSLSEAGGISAVVDLQDAPGSREAAWWFRLLSDTLLERRVALACLETLQSIQSGQAESPTALLNDLEARLRGAATVGQVGAPVMLREALHASVVALDGRRQNPGRPLGHHTPQFSNLSRRLSGFQPGRLYVLAGRPGSGKTAISIALAREVARSSGLAVMRFDLEMPRREVADRALVEHSFAGPTNFIDYGDFQEGRVSDSGYARLMQAADDLAELPIVIDDDPSVSIDDIRTRSIRAAHLHGDLGMIVVDYLQLVRTDNSRISRQQQIGKITRGLKQLAKDLSCPVLALAQLSRKGEDRADRKPRVSDLRESGDIEQDADVVILLHPEDQPDPQNDPEHRRGQVLEAIVGKNRAGRGTGTVRLVWWGRGQKHRELEP